MSSVASSQKTVRGGLVVLPPANSGGTPRVIAFQYNPETLTRTLDVQGAGDDPGDRLETLRLKGPPVEMIKFEAELDAVDSIGDGEVFRFDVAAQLAALESVVSPTAAQIEATQQLSQFGTLEIAPVEAPLTLFVWGTWRILPVRITDFAVTEEAFDALLQPVRARVSLGMRVLTTSDFPADHKGASLFLAHQRRREVLNIFHEQLNPHRHTDLGLGAIP